jgi:signal transduction histidine kinase
MIAADKKVNKNASLSIPVLVDSAADESEIRAALDRIVLDSLPAVCMGLGVLFALIAVSNLLLLPETVPPLTAAMMAALAELTAVILLVMYGVLVRRPVSPAFAHPLAALIAGLVLVNILVNIYSTGDALQTLNLVLLIVGAGFLLLSPYWLAVLILFTISGWSLLVWTLDPSRVWQNYYISLLSAVVLSLIIHIARVRSQRAAELLRRENIRSRAELAEVLVSTEEAQRSLATSMAVGQRISSILDLDSLLNQVADLIQIRFGGSFVGIFLVDESQEWLAARAGTGEDGRRLVREGLRFPIGGEGLVSLAAQKRRPVWSADVALDPLCDRDSALPGARSELAMPLEIGLSLLGVLVIQSEEQDAFKVDDIPFLQTLADQVAIAIQNAQLYQKITSFNQELEDKVRQRTEDLEAAYHELERLDRTKSDFIGVASHELRTPLTVVHGYCQMLLDDPSVRQNPLHQQLVQGIYAGSQRLNEIVGSLLDTARIESRILQLHKGPVIIHSLIENVAGNLRKHIEERSQVLVLGNLKSLPTIQADPDALRKVFHNLLVNAVKYTPDGGAITIESQCFRSQEEGEASAVEIIVSDTGIGIDPSLHELIFSKFYQTGEVSMHSSSKMKFKGGGPGLGLAIARGIVEAHGGRIWVESPGHDEESLPGSRFHVVLPLRSG